MLGQQQARIFDREALLARLGGDEHVLAAVVRVFLEDAPDQLDRLAEAVGARDYEAVRIRAHGLKGAAASIAAEPLREAALALERAGATRDIDATSRLLDGVVHEVEQLCAVLENATNSNG